MSDVKISAADVKALREATGAGMMLCKNALVEAGGDFDAAADIVRTKTGRKATERAGDRIRPEIPRRRQLGVDADGEGLGASQLVEEAAYGLIFRSGQPVDCTDAVNG